MSKIVGMSRNINLDYLNEVATLFLSGKPESEIKEILNEYLALFINSSTNIRKTREILLKIWVRDIQSMEEAKGLAVQLYKTGKKENKLISHWCLMNFAYPVFTDVCRNIGKMNDNFYSITTRNVKERMIEIWGERQSIIYSIDKIMKTLKDIEVLQVLPKNEYGINKYSVEDDIALVLIADTILYLRKKLYMSLDELNSCSEFFPFEYNITLDVLENSNLFLIDKFGGELVVSKK